MKKFISAALLVFFFTSFMQGQTHVWNGNGGDLDWFNTSNWEAGTIPSATSDVLISDGFMVEIKNQAAISNVIDIAGNSTLSIENNLTINQSIFTSEESNIIVRSGTIQGNIINNGVFLIETLEQKGFSNCSISNYGTINVVSSGTVHFNNEVSVFNSKQANITIESGGGFLEQSGVTTFNNEGIIQMLSDEMNRAFYMVLDINNSGVIDVGENQTFLFLVSSQNLNNISTGRIEGKGTLDITSNFTNSGTFSPAGINSIGSLDVVNNFSFSMDANLEIEIEGPNENEYDRISVIGFPTIEGAINIDLKYAPTLGEEFTVITANNITSCNLVEYLTAEFEGEEFYFEVICNNTNVILKVISEILNVSDFTSEKTIFTIDSNPVSEEVRIRIDEAVTDFENISVVLYNYLGQEIRSQKVNTSEIIVERMNISSGMYFLQLKKENRVLASQKIIFE